MIFSWGTFNSTVGTLITLVAWTEGAWTDLTYSTHT